MMSEKVLITYKRKRLLAGANPANVKAEASAKAEEEHCLACGCVNVNDNLLACRSCSGSYHLRCIDSLAEYLPEERWLCVACTKRCDIEVSRQNESQSGKVVDNKIVGESTMASKQSSQTVLLNSRSSECKCLERRPFPIDPTIKSTSIAVSSSNLDTDFRSVCGVLGETSRCQSTNLETEGRTSSINLNSQSERNTVSRVPEDCVFLVVCSDKRNDIMLKEDIPKDKYKTSLITFHRRVKKKPSVAAGPITKNQRVEDQHTSMATRSSHEVGDSCTCEDSTAPTEVAGPSRLPIIQQDMHNVKERVGLEAMLAGQGATDEHKKQCLQSSYDTSQNAKPLQSSEHGLQCQLDKSVAPPTSDAAKDPALLLIDKLSGIVSSDTSMRKEKGKGNELSSEERGLNIVMPENLVESQSSSSQNIAPIIVNEETDGSAKCLQLPEKLDNMLKEPEEEIITFSQMDKCRTNCRIVTNGSTPSGNPINLSANVLLNQDMSTESINCISRLEERIVINNSTFGKKHHKWASNNSTYTDFLGLSSRLDSEVHEVSVDGLQSLPLDLSLRDTVERYIRQHRQDSKGEVSSVSQEKLVHDNELIGLQLLKGRTLFDKLQKFSPEWSEEELDCLWIGARRHGLRNWSNILRDPKLCFSESRVAEDLAEQWDREQIKLLSGTLSQPVRARSNVSVPHETGVSFWANKVSGSLYCEKVVSSYMEFPTQRLETKLSLGGVYAQSDKKAKRNLPYLSDLSVHNSLAPKSSTANPFLASNLMGSINPWAGTQHHNAFKKRYARYDCESSTSPQKSFENVVPEQRSACSTLPHWLKEVFSMPQRQNSLPVSSAVASLNSSMVNTDERVALFSSVGEPLVPLKDSRGRGILKRKNMAYRENAADVRMSENSVSMENPSLRKRFSLLPDLGLTPLIPTSVNRISGPSDKILDLNKTSSDLIGPSNLVVIDSDASSEGTISDDQGSRR